MPCEEHPYCQTESFFDRSKLMPDEMRWIFQSQDVLREDLAALRIFSEAALSETATAELARRVLRSLLKVGGETESP